jgi:hypothetical protein
MHDQDSFLLQNQLNPFPIPGRLVLADDGRLSFTLSAKAAGASLGWLEKTIGADRLKQRIESGKLPVVFDLPVADRKITWPKSLGGYAMRIEDHERDWTSASTTHPAGASGS